MTLSKTVSVRRGRRFHLEPEHRSDVDLFRGWLRLAHGGSLAERLRGFGTISRAILARGRRS
jgi:hypothetical protein